jgi:hypothetical protein
LTSTYFESLQPDDENDKRRYRYSRDKRSDCVQVMVALIVKSTRNAPCGDARSNGQGASQADRGDEKSLTRGT